MHILVTGGAGFIGGNLCSVLVHRGHEVRVLDDLSTGRRENIAGSGVDFREATLLDRSAVSDAARGVDAIVHLGALPSVPRSLRDPIASHHANATGTLHVLEAARSTGTHVIVASSSSVYGAVREMPKRESLPTRPMSPYAVSKLATEAYALAYGHSFGLPALAFRFFNVYGPLQSAGHAYAAVIPTFISAALIGESLPVFGDGEQSRDFTSVATVAAILAEAVERRVISDEPINLALGTTTTLNALIAELESLVGRVLPISRLPARSGEVRASSADPSSLKTHFPHVQPVSLRDGLGTTLDWFRQSTRSSST
jgi:UDP-glucose 4-epimerase